MSKNEIDAVPIILEMDDSEEIELFSWKPKAFMKKVPKYILCISHGMAEHALRYSDFANFMCKNDIVVFAHNHRGHGSLYQKKSELGVLSVKEGFNRVVHDLDAVITYAKKQYPGVRVILLGHSFGSFIAQSYIQDFGDEIFACILSGTAGPNSILTTLGELVANIVKKIKGSKHPSKFLDTLTFGSYNNKINNPYSEKAWLSRDNEVVQKYEDDSLCGFLCTAGFFSNLTHGLNQIHKNKNLRRVRKDLPVLLFAGTADPVGNYTKTIKTLAQLYRKHDVKSVSEKYYEGGRHEMLNEINKDEVYDDLLNWISKL